MFILHNNAEEIQEFFIWKFINLGFILLLCLENPSAGSSCGRPLYFIRPLSGKQSFHSTGSATDFAQSCGCQRHTQVDSYPSQPDKVFSFDTLWFGELGSCSDDWLFSLHKLLELREDETTTLLTSRTAPVGSSKIGNYRQWRTFTDHTR